MQNQGIYLLSALTLACAAGHGCGSGGEGSGSTGTGTGGAPASSSTGDAMDGGLVSTSVGGAGTGGEGSGGATGSSTASSSGSSGSASSSGVGGSAPGCTPKSGAVLAVSKIYYGDTNFDGTTDKTNAWKQFGFNLDGKVSTAASVDLCKPQAGASPSMAYTDGNGGIDNSFGKNIMPMLLGLSASFSAHANEAITKGYYTVMFDLEALGAGPDQAPILGKYYSSTKLGSPPKFDGSDCWPVAPERLTNAADITSAKLTFPMGAVAANHWSSGLTSGTMQLEIDADGFDIHLDILEPRVVMDLDVDHQGAHTGHIGGVIATSQLVTEMKRVAGTFDTTLCSGQTISIIVAQIQKSSDILANGTQDPTKTCDGISIGLGFEAEALSLGGVGPATPPLTDPCAP